MDRVAALQPDERAELFDETAARLDLPSQIIEKDYWVCWTLKQLFTHEPLRSQLVFKGGTSLSKVFGLIHRFSEDIDLAVDWQMLGFTGAKDPLAERSKNKQAKLHKEMIAACRSFIADELRQTLTRLFEEKLDTSAPWELSIDPDTPDALVFTYPTVSKPTLGYIRPGVVMELGTHAELLPNGRYTIRPYAAEQFPDFFEDAKCPVAAITAERNFWEKATILHAEHHRPDDKRIPLRYSRHYYDVAMMADTVVAKNALADESLLQRVVLHKQLFYASAWARYELAKFGTVRLVPTDTRVAELRRDYSQMAVMLFGDIPSFETILHKLRSLEDRINHS